MWRLVVAATLAAARVASAQLPDLVPEAFDIDIRQGTSVNAGDVIEGCASAETGLTLLRFSMRARNIGAGDLFLGDPGCPDCRANPGAPCTNPYYVCSTAHGHAHFNGYARAELVSVDTGLVATGRKIGFCLLDLECATPKYSCSFQGLTAGCADVYLADLPCQYIDLTGITLTPGDYVLRVTVDPDNRLAESDETNNVVEVPLTRDCVTSPELLPACTPGSFLCYGTRVGGRPEPRLAPAPTVGLLGSFGAFDMRVTRSRELCTPAVAGTSPMTDATTHLRAYAAVDPARFTPVRGVRIVTQLGETALDVLRPDGFAGPGATDAVADPPAPVAGHHSVDRFACFRVKTSRTARKAAHADEVAVSDRFLSSRTLVVKKPRRLCSPVAVDGTPVLIATRHLLCFDVARPPAVRSGRIHVRDGLGATVVDLGRPRELCLVAEKNPPRPAAETLEPCAGRADVWRFDARAGATVEVRVDTTDATTAADLCAEVACGDLHLAGDDETACTFGPPSYRCPDVRGVATSDGSCVATVHTCAAGCASAARADYALRAAVAGEDAAPVLIVDDGPAGP
ncbi:MAG TPA: lysyl oxidase family protein [Candidatus Eisenbacteria bacterium]|nr:lysyl oxidase family protein [Candidatus Eisenbacteria bacterium]